LYLKAEKANKFLSFILSLFLSRVGPSDRSVIARAISNPLSHRAREEALGGCALISRAAYQFSHRSQVGRCSHSAKLTLLLNPVAGNLPVDKTRQGASPLPSSFNRAKLVIARARARGVARKLGEFYGPNESVSTAIGFSLSLYRRLEIP